MGWSKWLLGMGIDLIIRFFVLVCFGLAIAFIDEDRNLGLTFFVIGVALVAGTWIFGKRIRRFLGEEEEESKDDKNKEIAQSLMRDGAIIS